MDQIKIGVFLKELRKEKALTQEQVAEKLNVSNRTVSRWETGSNMPDIGMLVELADFYGVSIPEIIQGERKSENMEQETIIQGERKSENMEQETRETAVAMAAYSRKESKAGKQKIISILLMAFGIFIIISALLVFPNESSWGSIYSVLGSVILLAGVYLITRPMVAKGVLCILIVFGCACSLFGVFALSDYVAVTQFNEVPRFRYMTVYDSRYPNQLLYKTLFFTAVRKNPGKENEEVYILEPVR